MAKLLLISSCLLSIAFQINSQIITAPNYFNRPNQELLFDIPRNYIELPRNYLDFPNNFVNIPRIIEAPRNYLQAPSIVAESPVISVPKIPSTTVISDCTPSICQNLADTINLMIVSNLLQNTLPDLRTLRMVAPYLKNIPKFDVDRLSGRFNSNVPYPGPMNPNLIAPNFVAPNVGPPRLVVNNPAPPNIVGPNTVASNVPIGGGAMLSTLLKLLGNTV